MQSPALPAADSSSPSRAPPTRTSTLARDRSVSLRPPGGSRDATVVRLAQRFEVLIPVATRRTFTVYVVDVHRRLATARFLAHGMLLEVRGATYPPVPVVLTRRTLHLPLVLITPAAHHFVDAVVLSAERQHLHTRTCKGRHRCHQAQSPMQGRQQKYPCSFLPSVTSYTYSHPSGGMLEDPSPVPSHPAQEYTHGLAGCVGRRSSIATRRTLTASPPWAEVGSWA